MFSATKAIQYLEPDTKLIFRKNGIATFPPHWLNEKEKKMSSYFEKGF